MDSDERDRSEEQFESSLAGAAQHKPPATASPQSFGQDGHNDGREQPRATTSPVPNSEAWRDEVASRVSSYRKRRRRYDPDLTLRLEFEAQRQANRMALAQETVPEDAVPPVRTQAPPPPPRPSEPEPQPLAPARRVRNIIAFPHRGMFNVEHLPLDELVPEPPRILEAAEEPSPPQQHAEVQLPAITLDDDQPDEQATIPELELPLRVAPLAHRIWSGVVDSAMVGIGCAMFTAIFTYFAHGVPRTRMALPIAAVVLLLLWAGYHYLLLVSGGTTPGMRLTRLAMITFEGEALRRSARRKRALAMVISCLPLGLGFLWAFLDADALCWHDRITGTYLIVHD